MPISVIRIACLLLGLLVAGAQPAAAQRVSVQASVDETTVGIGDRITYTLEVRGATFPDIETPQPPLTENLALMQATPSLQRNLSMVNGQVSQSIAFRWFYRPLRQGSARIHAAEVVVEDQTYRTDPIAIDVLAQSPRRPGRTPSRFGTDPDADAEEGLALQEEDLFIRATPSATTAYQNEQVTVEYRLYFRPGIQLGQSRLADSWDAEGFWREDLEVDPRPIPRVVVEDGIRYHMIVLKRVAVFPTRAGRLTVDPLRIETEVYLPFGSRDPFARFFGGGRSRFEPVEVASPPVTVEARALPSGAPESFQGAVGTFRMNVEVDRTTVEVGEPVEVRVHLTGSGNLATLPAPALAPPGVFEQYDPQVRSSLTRSGQRIQGSKTFTYVLVPRSNGTFTLPPVVFSYLDPTAGRYETLRAEPVALRVTGSAETPLARSTTSGGLPVDDIAGIRTGAAGWQRTTRAPLHLSLWPYLTLLLPVLAVGGLFAYRRHTARLESDPEYARSRVAHPTARRHLKRAQDLLDADEPRLFYEELERAVLGFIGNRLNVAELGLTRQHLDAHLAAAGLSPDRRAELGSLLDACDRARFAPLLPGRAAMEADRARAERLIAALDRLLRRPAAQPANL